MSSHIGFIILDYNNNNSGFNSFLMDVNILSVSKHSPLLEDP